jgi:hypothetical protein
VPVPATVSVPTVLPQFKVRAELLNSLYASKADAGPIMLRLVTVAPLAVPALRPIL